MNTRSLIGPRPSPGAASLEFSNPPQIGNLLRTGALPVAFTLIELLVVIAVISVIAAMIFPVTGAVNRAKIRRRAASELAQVQVAIEAYKAKLGHYPPDALVNGTPWVNQLYYELKGTDTTNNATAFVTLDRTAQLSTNVMGTLFGTTGFINSSLLGSGDEARTPANLIKDLRPSSYLLVDVPGRGQAYLLGTTLDGPGPAMLQGVNGGKLNPWRYNSSNPTNSPSGYDLWVDVLIAGKTNRISNWSREPLIVNSLF